MPAGKLYTRDNVAFNHCFEHDTADRSGINAYG